MTNRTPILDDNGQISREDPAVIWLVALALRYWREYRTFRDENPSSPVKLVIFTGQSRVVETARREADDWPGHQYAYAIRAKVIAKAASRFQYLLRRDGVPDTQRPNLTTVKEVLKSFLGALSGRGRRRALTPEQVRFIRAEYDAGGVNANQLAKLFNVAPVVVYQVVNGVTYRDVI